MELYPVEFEQTNRFLNRPENWNSETDGLCGQLPVYQTTEGTPRIVSCWRMRFRDRLRFLFHSRLWVTVAAYSQPPVSLVASEAYFPELIEEVADPDLGGATVGSIYWCPVNKAEVHRGFTVNRKTKKRGPLLPPDDSEAG